MRSSVFVTAAAVVGFGLAAAGALMADREGRRYPATFSLTSLGDVWLSMLACDAKGVWLGATRRVEADEVRAIGVEQALGSQPFSLIRLAGGEERVLFSGRGAPIAVSVAEDGAVWLLVQSPAEPSGTTPSRLSVSEDDGTSWTTIGFPDDIVGIAFVSRKAGYCWSSNRLHSTTDGGKSWRSIEVGTGRVAGRSEPGRPVLGPDGSLWVPLHPRNENANAALEDGALLRVGGPASPARLSLPGERIEGVAVDSSGATYLALSPSRASGCRVVRTPSGSDGSGLQELWSEKRGICRLESDRGLLLVDFTDDFEPNSLLSAWPRRAVLSADAGRTWFTSDLTKERASSICPTRRGFWVVSQTHRQLRFHPVALGNGPTGKGP